VESGFSRTAESVRTDLDLTWINPVFRYKVHKSDMRMPVMWEGFGVSVVLAFLIAGALGFYAKWGRITAKSLVRNSWRAIFLFIVIGAGLSPTTDPLNVLFTASPMLLSYALSIGIAWFLHPVQPLQPGHVK
jgi:hypothetical protein